MHAYNFHIQEIYLFQPGYKTASLVIRRRQATSKPSSREMRFIPFLPQCLVSPGWALAFSRSLFLASLLSASIL
ncbi:hypothetical protein TNCV_4216061 [Trichonephila clavipes]|nr:hypothetical protein TNCV_4216061 [Trichonephila clavipes]